MKNLLWSISVLSLLLFAACQSKDASLATQITEQAAAAEANVPEFTTTGTNLSNLVDQVQKVPDALKKDTASNYELVQRRIVTFQPKYDKLNGDYESLLQQMKTLSADYAAGKIGTDEAKKKYDEISAELKSIGEHLKSYQETYNQFSADYAKMMADFKGSTESN
ncbi:MAG: hypothetical protein JNL02_16490 [Saprospiraceae bacterium]|nr:hypothetical protein [Saprospiraceae bacterium]MCC7505135.1 hypothetical protein [Saprospiraceae bacterium]